MTKTTVTREEIDSSYGPVSDLGALFRALEDKFLRNGEVICQFKLNGMNLTEADEQRLSQITLDDVQLIEIDSETPTALLFGLLENWVQELPDLAKNTDELAKEIKFNGVEGHLKAFVNLVDSCQFLMESLMSLRTIIKSSALNILEWDRAEQMTARAIGEALGAFEKKDFVLLAEILEYDLGHSLQTWLEQIKIMLTKLKEENARDAQEFSDRVFNKRG